MRTVSLLLILALVLPCQAQKHFATGDRVIRGNRLISARSQPGQQLSAKVIKPVEQQIVIDAVKDESDWQKAQVVAPFMDENENTEKTTVRVLSDARNIYLFADVYEPDGLTAKVSTRDSVLVGDDYLQVNLKPWLPDSIKVARDYYYSIVVTPKGTVWDSYFDPYLHGYFFSSWNANASVATKRQDKRWSVEIKIPYADLDHTSNPGWKWNLDFRHHSQISEKEERLFAPRIGVTVEQGVMVRRPALVQYYWTRPEFLQEVKPPTPSFHDKKVWAIKISHPPVLDKKPDTKLWGAAQKIAIAYKDESGEKIKRTPARAQVATTSHQLCFRLEAPGAKVEKRKKNELELGQGMGKQMAGINGVFRDEALFADECFWLWLQPRSRKADNIHQDSYLIILNNRGEVKGIHYDAFGTPDRNWQPSAKVDIYNTSTGWGSELSIDIRSFDLPVECSNQWGFNVFRNQKSKENSELQAWLYTANDYLNPAKMGTLENVQTNNQDAARQAIAMKIKRMKKAIASHGGRNNKQTISLLRQLDGIKLQTSRDMLRAQQMLQNIDQKLGVLDAKRMYESVPHPTKGGYAFLDVQVLGDRAWAVGAMGTAFYSEDGGQSWQRSRIETDADLYRVFFVNENEGWAAGGRIRMGRTNEEMRHDQRGGYGYIFHSTDGGRSWRCQYGERGRHLFGLYFVNDKIGYACGELGFLLKTKDGGEHWTALPTTGTYRWLYGISFLDEDHGFIVGESETVLETRDGGKSWHPRSIPADKKFYGFRPFYRDIDFHKNSGCIVGQNGAVVMSSDGGQTWRPVATFIKDEVREFLDLTRVHFVSSLKAYAVGELGTRLLVTEDGGQSWSLRPVPNRDWLRGVWADAGGRVVLAGEREKILISADGGWNWKMVHGDDPKTDVLVMMAHGDDAPINLGAFYANYAINEGKRIVDIEVLRDAHSVEYKGEIYNLEHHRDIRMSGVRTTTYFDEFENGNNGADYYHFTERLWKGEQNVVRHMVAAIRAYRPDIVIIHGGVFGDYDKPGHKLSGRAGIPAFETSGGESDQWPELTRLGLPPWQAKKLYCRASESYPMTLDLAPLGKIPLKGTSGTCHDWGEYVIRNFQSQGVYHTRDGKLCLIKSLVPVPEHETSVFDGLPQR